MPDSLTQTILQKLGVRMPQAPDRRSEVSPEQLQLRDEMIKRDQAKQSGIRRAAQQLMTSPAEMLSGLFYDPTQAPTSEERNPAFAAGAMAAALPLGPKGIKGAFSRVEKIAESLPETISTGKLASILKNRASGEEVGWRGLDKLLAGKQQVSRGDVIKQLEQNPLDVKVISKGGPRPTTEHQLDSAGGMVHPDWERGQYEQYTMPGASNYREDLIQLARPGAKGTLSSIEDDLARNLSPNAQDFLGHHWDEPNVLVHVRHNERVLPADKEQHLSSVGPPKSFPKSRMLENVQSDWHQAGAHRGYNTEAQKMAEGVHPAAMAVDVAAQDLSKGVQQAAEKFGFDHLMQNAYDNFDYNGLASEAMRHLTKLSQEGNQQAAEAASDLLRKHTAFLNAQDAQVRAERGGPVPEAPFKDSWVELALKQQLLDIAHNRPDLEWLGIAPSSELRSRGEEISPEFQDVQLPRTLEKLLKPFGGKVEQTGLGVKPNHEFDYNDQMGQFGGFETAVRDRRSEQIYSLLGPRFNPEMKSIGGPGEGFPTAALTQLRKGRPDITAPIARLTPEILKQLREKGFPLLTILAMLQQQQEQ